MLLSRDIGFRVAAASRRRPDIKRVRDTRRDREREKSGHGFGSARDGGDELA